MEYVNFIVVFVCAWWLSLFCVLPLGNAPDDHVTTGNADSAPKKPRIKMKLLMATGLAIILSGGYSYIVYLGFLRF